MQTLKRYIQASSRQRGALGIFQVYADEPVLAHCIDARVGGKKKAENSNALEGNELRYGWLRRDDETILDEVMLARPGPGMRVLMTHGGNAVREAVEWFFQENGFEELTRCDQEAAREVAAVDGLLDPILAGCVTEAQAAAVLEARRDGGTAPAHRMAIRRLVVAGPPNAGKSSLLNQLAGYERAFVHHEAGATRDVVDELVDLGGFAVLLGDLPGFSEDREDLDKAAWDLAAKRLALAEGVLFVVDGSREWEAAEAAAKAVADLLPGQGGWPVLVVLNKSDLPSAIDGRPWAKYFPQAEGVRACSLADGDAAEVVGEAVAAMLDRL